MRFYSLLLILLVLFSRTSAASMFGEENIQLGALVAQGIAQAEKVQSTLDYVRQTTEFVRDTAAFAREAVQVERSVEMLLTDPALLFAHSEAAWRQAFPELEDILGHSREIKLSIEAARRSFRAPLYDPYAYVRVLDSLHDKKHGSFEALAHAIDDWGLNDPHDAAIRILKDHYKIAEENLSRLATAVNISGISPTQAAIYTAQATSAAAAAQVQAAATLDHISRNLELMITDQVAQVSKDAAQFSVQAAGAVQTQLKSWRLDLLSPRKTRR
jgi:hypothetical protein